jgi:hypothetical protein
MESLSALLLMYSVLITLVLWEMINTKTSLEERNKELRNDNERLKWEVEDLMERFVPK